MKNYLLKKEFWIAAGHRAARTMAQVFISTVGVATVLEEVNWRFAISAAALAGLLSVATSVITGLPEVED